MKPSVHKVTQLLSERTRIQTCPPTPRLHLLISSVVNNATFYELAGFIAASWAKNND